MWQYIYQNELYHYGVLGMKWGVHRALRKESANSRLERKAIKYDKKEAEYIKRAEKAHAKNDLGKANRAMIKSAKYAKKASKFDLKALNTSNQMLKDRYNSKSYTMKYKSAKEKRKGNRISKLTGYGIRSMKLSDKASKFSEKAAKARMMLAKNQRYINTMKRKTSSFSQEQIKMAESWIKGWNVKYN